MNYRFWSWYDVIVIPALFALGICTAYWSGFGVAGLIYFVAWSALVIIVVVRWKIIMPHRFALRKKKENPI